MLNYFLLSEDCEKAAFGASRRSFAFGGPTSGPTPDVSEITIAAPRPLRCTGISDGKARGQGHAMRCRMGAVYGRFSFVSHRRRAGLSGQEHWVRVGFLVQVDGDAEQQHEGCYDGRRVRVPLRKEARHALVEFPHRVVKQPHGRDRSAGTSRRCVRKAARVGRLRFEQSALGWQGSCYRGQSSCQPMGQVNFTRRQRQRLSWACQ